MPEKSKYFSVSKFPGEIIKQSLEIFIGNNSPSSLSFRVKYSDEVWTFHNLNEFLSEYRKDIKGVEIKCSINMDKLFIFIYEPGQSYLDVALTTRDEIIDVFEVFERQYENYKISQSAVEEILSINIKDKIKIFIGHGRSTQWRDLKDHLHEKHGYKVVAYETGARAGYTITEVLSDLKSQANIAFLVHTAEDQDKDELFHARENVIHETGLFQGFLGFKRAIILLEEGTHEYTNISGVQQIRYTKDNIKEVFGEVVAIINREFKEEAF